MEAGPSSFGLLSVPDPIPRSFTPWSDASSSGSDSSDEARSSADATPEADLDSAKSEVEQIIDHLSRLAIAIRKSGSNSRAYKADRHFRPADHQELRDHLFFLILARGTREGNVGFKIESDHLTPVQERLVTANLRRRNRFLYAQRHAQKLAADGTRTKSKFALGPFGMPSAMSVNDETAESRILDIVSPKSVSTSQLGDAPPEPDRLPPPLPYAAVMTATSASAVETRIEAVPQRVTKSEVAKTNITSTAAKVLYPRPPRLKEGLRYFRCPCCCQTLPEMFRQDTLWK